MAAPFEFDRTWAFELGADALWETLLDTDRYSHWWGWLRRFDLEGDGLTPGSVAHCEVRAPLPYSLRFEVAVDDVEPASRVLTTVRGDLAGPARLEIEPDGSARCRARLAWEVRLEDRVLRRLALVARPGMVWAHDRVVEAGVTSFAANVLRTGSETPNPVTRRTHDED